MFWFMFSQNDKPHSSDKQSCEDRRPLNRFAIRYSGLMLLTVNVADERAG